MNHACRAMTNLYSLYEICLETCLTYNYMYLYSNSLYSFSYMRSVLIHTQADIVSPVRHVILQLVIKHSPMWTYIIIGDYPINPDCQPITLLTCRVCYLYVHLIFFQWLCAHLMCHRHSIKHMMIPSKNNSILAW